MLLTSLPKRARRQNWILSGVLLAVYLLTYIIDLAAGGSITPFRLFQTAGTLIGLLAALSWWMEPIYYGGVALFACAALYGGGMLDFYTRFSEYDICLHFLSGILLVWMGHYILRLLLLLCKAQHPLPYCVTLSFSWLFSAASAGIWEIFEFVTDLLFGLQSQLGLWDTMTDICAGVVGSLIGVLLLHLFLRCRSLSNP